MNHARRNRGAVLALAALMPMSWLTSCGSPSVAQSNAAAPNPSALSSGPMAPAAPTAVHPATEQADPGMLSVLSVEHEVEVLAKRSGEVVEGLLEESKQV